MGVAFLHGNGGGGGSDLNFRVLGGTAAPSSPKENDIWVNTDQEMTFYAFQPYQPSSPAEGWVWIRTGTDGVTGFNALKKNRIQLYPISAKQYVGGAWTDVTAKSYKGGKWVDWWIPGTLFVDGTDDTALTGGWTSYAESVDSGYAGKTADVSIQNDVIRITFKPGSSNYSSTNISTVNNIDMTGYDSVHFEFVSASGSGWAKLTVPGATSDMVDIHRLDDVGSLDVDISKLSADTKKACKVGLLLWTNTGNQTITVEISLARLL